MPDLPTTEEYVDIPDDGNPIYVSLISKTPSNVRFLIQLEQMPLPTREIADGNDDDIGTPFPVERPFKLLHGDRLRMSAQVSQNVAEPGFELQLAFWQDGKQVARSKAVRRKYTANDKWFGVYLNIRFK